MLTAFNEVDTVNIGPINNKVLVYLCTKLTYQMLHKSMQVQYVFISTQTNVIINSPSLSIIQCVLMHTF